MTCDETRDRIYDFDGDGEVPFFTQLRIQIHLLHCSRCAGEFEKLRTARNLMGETCFPQAPSLADALMGKINLESPEEEFPAAAGVSFRSWVITGLLILVSLATAFLGLDFVNVSAEWGSSFLIPIGITVGAIVTAYGALFIGSHLKELTDHFNLR